MSLIKVVECPRDAMQSIKMFIPTDKKIKYIQSLVDVGFDSIDMGMIQTPLLTFYYLVLDSRSKTAIVVS